MLKVIYRIEGKWRFCPGDKCPHYGKATKYPRKCYYEPQCWRSVMDVVIFLLKGGFRHVRDKSAGFAGRNKEHTIKPGERND